jgi:hypothetical protein
MFTFIKQVQHYLHTLTPFFCTETRLSLARGGFSRHGGRFWGHFQSFHKGMKVGQQKSRPSIPEMVHGQTAGKIPVMTAHVCAS